MLCQRYSRLTIPNIKEKQEVKNLMHKSLNTHKKSDSTNLVIRKRNKNNTKTKNVNDQLLTARQLPSIILFMSNRREYGNTFYIETYYYRQY